MVETLERSLVYVGRGTDSAVGVGYLSNVAETPQVLLVHGLIFAFASDQLYRDLSIQGWKMPELVPIGKEKVECLPARMYIRPCDGLYSIITGKDAVEVPKVLEMLHEEDLPQVAMMLYNGEICARAIPPGTPLHIGW
jgi:hypothetical protein